MSGILRKPFQLIHGIIGHRPDPERWGHATGSTTVTSSCRWCKATMTVPVDKAPNIFPGFRKNPLKKPGSTK